MSREIHCYRGEFGPKIECARGWKFEKYGGKFCLFERLEIPGAKVFLTHIENGEYSKSSNSNATHRYIEFQT